MAGSVDHSCRFLESLQRTDLAMLLTQCEVEIAEVEVDNGYYQDLITEARVHAPSPIDQALLKLSPTDRKRIAEAIASADPNRRAPNDISVKSSGAAAQGSPCLLADLILHRAMMISVATGGDRIEDVNDYYKVREASIRERLPEGIEYSNPHGDLWDWYHLWKAKFSTYADRRSYVRQLFAPVITSISARPKLRERHREPTGWDRVDRALTRARTNFDTASAEEDFQAIGLLCREVLISVAQAVFDPAIHKTVDGVTASQTDAGRMLEAYIAHVFPGGSNQEIRTHFRASLALALNLQHRRTATRQLAALCLEATTSAVAVVSIIAKAAI